jgi:hypothetical protein
MSKLFDYIKATQTNERIVKRMRMVDVQNTAINYLDVYRYRVVATLGSEVTIGNTAKPKMTNDNFEQMLREKVYRPLAEHIFGEFRLPLIEAQFAAFNGDSEQACKLIEDVLNSMFNVGESK